MTVGAGIDQAEDRQAKKQEQQRLSEPRASAASDASQGQTEAALGQGGAALGQSEGLQVRLPAAPLFVAQSPAGKGPAEGWVKRYLAMHPDCKEDEALKGANP